MRADPGAMGALRAVGWAVCAGSARGAAERASFSPLVQGSIPWRPTRASDSLGLTQAPSASLGDECWLTMDAPLCVNPPQVRAERLRIHGPGVRNLFDCHAALEPSCGEAGGPRLRRGA